MPVALHAEGKGASASCHSGQTTIGDYPLNQFEFFRAEIIKLNGNCTVRLSRWKRTALGLRPTGQAFEFGSHRTNLIAGMIADVQSALSTHEGAR